MLPRQIATRVIARGEISQLLAETVGTCLACRHHSQQLEQVLQSASALHDARTSRDRSDRDPWRNAMNRRRQRLLRDANGMVGTASVAFALAGLLIGMVGAVILLQTLQFGPPVGEILRFGPYDGWTPVWQIDAERSTDRHRCVLKPAVMAATHGSMVVEQRRDDGRTFLIHWAGGPTSNDRADCGSAADLMVGLTAMQTLLNADAAGQHWHFIGS